MVEKIHRHRHCMEPQALPYPRDLLLPRTVVNSSGQGQRKTETDLSNSSEMVRFLLQQTCNRKY